MSYADKKIIKNSIFLKVEEGTPHTIRLMDADPTEQWQHKMGQKMETCGGEGCAYCADGLPRNQRFVTNVYDHTDNKVYLWSYGPMVAENLAQIAKSLEKDGENILEHDLEVTAKGSGMQKKTTIQPRFKTIPVPAGIKLHSIGRDQVPF